MTPREAQVMELIRKNPQMSQEEIAQRLNIKRASVAAHIRNLVEKGYILGRGYILKEESYVAVVGGANMDLRGFPKGDFQLEDSNPGIIQSSPGGVGRNIAENMARLGLNVSMICILGEDLWGKELLDSGRQLGLSFEHAFLMPGEKTPVYLEILDDQKEMVAAINQMDLLDRLSPDFLRRKEKILKNAEFLVLDCNLSKESLAYLFQLGHERVFVDGVSMVKVTKIQDFLDHIYLLKLNHHEAARLSGQTIQGPEDLEKAGKILMNQGPEYLVITYGKEGAWGFHKDQILRMRPKPIQVKNATGAGDAFTAGLSYGFSQGKSFDQCLYLGMGASALALESEGTNSDQMSVKKLEKKAKEIYNAQE